MKSFLRFGIAACLLYNALLFAQASSVGTICTGKNDPVPCTVPPRPIYAPPPTYSDKAHRANYQGTCVLGLTVEVDGSPSNIHVLSGLGMGLDEKAIEAVKKWRFKPAMKEGKPVAMEIAVETTFRLLRTRY